MRLLLALSLMLIATKPCDAEDTATDVAKAKEDVTVELVIERANRALAIAGFVLPPVSPGAAAQPVYPGKQWVTAKPSKVGLDAARLKAFSQFIGGRGCVVRHGYMCRV